MATVAVEVITRASPAQAWDALQDVGALHTRLVPGFVTATKLVPGGREVTFANGATVEEPIIECNDQTRRLSWTLRGSSMGIVHYNAAAQVFANSAGGSRVVWMADVLPHEAASAVHGMMRQGAVAMKAALDKAAGES